MKSRWQKVPLGEIAPARSAPMPNGNDEVWNLSLEDIESDTGLVKRKSICRVSQLGSTKCSFDARHVLYSKLRPYLNKVVVPDESGVGTSELIPMLPNPDRLNRQFLAHYLRSCEFLEFAQANTRGANLPRIAMAELWSHLVPVPNSLDEQDRIVARINECMEKVREIEKLRCDTEFEARGLENASFHDFILDGLDQGKWPLTELGDVTKSFRYGSSAKAHLNSTGIPILRMGNINDGYLDYTNLKFVELSDREVDKYRLKAGDILINRTNSLELVGKAAMFDRLEGDWVYASYLVCAEVDRTRVHPEYVVGVINSRMGRNYVLATARRAIGMVNINAKEMARFPLPLPPLGDQAKIVGRMAHLRATADSLRLQLAAPDRSQLRSAVLKKAFAGEL